MKHNKISDWPSLKYSCAGDETEYLYPKPPPL